MDNIASMKNFNPGKYINQGSYKSFQPEFINKTWELDNEIWTLLSEADRMIGKLDSFSDFVPNLDMFLSMHIIKESAQSTKIEGTQINIEDALIERVDISEEKKDDWDELQNYMEAMNFAMERLKDLPFSSKLIREIHRILLQNVRGKHKSPGEYRRSQNWIGGATIKDAVFIPPVYQDVPDYISDIEKFAHNTELNIPELIKIGIIHYQFETVHPFQDGNGRVGRLLITLYLIEKGLLRQPLLYLSDFFERHKELYYGNLMKVRTSGDIRQWLKFFLVGISETCEKGLKTLTDVLELQKETDEKIKTLGTRTGNAAVVVNYLYKRPIIDVDTMRDIVKLSTASTYKLLKDLEALGILKLFLVVKRKKIYSFADYLKIYTRD
ncbi:MAG: Fic family protein [Rikenellaceae bacterium]|nr:Fic family protein [Rikenellaceae bacterium]